MQNRILIVEDDQEIREMLRTLLEREGYCVEVAEDGLEGEQAILNNHYHVIVLDIMLPKKDGLALLQAVRGQTHSPIMMLTAKGDELDRIIGFELGADDYLPKPFHPREFLARIKALLRRIAMDEQNSNIEESTLRLNNLAIYPKRREVKVDDKPVNLTAAEFRVLMVLARTPNQLITRAQLTEQALGRKLTLYDRAIDMHLSNLRKKLSDQYIKTIRGEGVIYQADTPS